MTLDQLGAGIDFVADTPPANAADGDTLLDTSLSPPQVKVFDASVGSFIRPQTAQNLDQKVSQAGADLKLVGTFALVNEEFSGASFDVSTQTIAGNGLAFSATGDRMFVFGRSSNFVFQYVLSSSFDLTTATFDNSFDASGQVASGRSVTFSPTGDQMFVTGNTTDSVFQYNLSSSFDVTTAVFDTSFDVSSQSDFPSDVSFSATGGRMFIADPDASSVLQFNLSSGFDVTTAVFDTSFDVSAQSNGPVSATFSQNGDRMLVIGEQAQSVFQYSLNTEFDISTAVFTSSFDVSGEATDPEDMAFSSAGDQMFVLDNGANAVFRYFLGRVGRK
jgi:hypothetical protein